ncbi:MAG: Type prepilin peptidase TadV/CpaA [Myxococcaceae bacterium]|nr:Type prepilin peptidase TadV/CpaA [Myxococcaceae bacterium]
MDLKETLWLVLAVALLISVVTDVVSRRILDLVTFPTIAIALALRWLQGVGDLEGGLVSGLVAGGAAAGFFAVLAWRGGAFGWGDVKLVAAVGAVFGYPLIMGALLFISLAGALQAIVTLIWQGAVWDTLRAVGLRWGKRLKLSKHVVEAPARHIPYGVAIALGSFWAMWWDKSNN